MKTSSKFILTGIASLMLVTGASIVPATAELSKVGPINQEVNTVTQDGKEMVGITDKYGGFPQWFEDTREGKPLRLELCLEASISRTPAGYCLTEPDLSKPFSVSDTDPLDSGFPDEAFWWTAEAQVNTTVIREGRSRTVQALLVLATEAAFGNEDVINGDQLAFNRTRIRISGTALKENVKYKITYPYGVKILTATRKDSRKPPEINLTEDFGCAPGVTECDFSSLLRKDANRGRTLNNIGRPWLVWDSSLPGDQPPIGYIGDPNVEHKVIGSIIQDSSGRYQNYFKVEELNSDGKSVVGAPIAYTDLFSVSGKLAPVEPAPTTPTGTTSSADTTTNTTTTAPVTTAPAPATAPATGG